MPDPVQEYLAKYGPQEDPVAAYLAKYGPQEEPPETTEPKKRIAPMVRLAQGILGMSKLVVGSGEEPRRRIGPTGEEEAGERPAWARVPGEKVAEWYEALEERQPRPEFEALETGSAGELAASLGRNIPALVAEGVEMAPGLVAAETSLAKLFPSIAAKAPAAKGFMDIAGGVARTGQRARHGAALGEAYAILSGEAVEHPEALVIDPLLFAGLEPVAGAFGDMVMTGTRAARGVGRTEGVPSTLRSLLSPREVPADAAVGRDIAEALAIRSAEPGSGVAGQAARPALAPELTEKGNLRHVLRGTDRADLGEAGAQLGRVLEDESHAAKLATDLEQLARQQRVGSVVAPEYQPEVPGFVPRPGEGVAGAAARPSLAPELTEKGNLRQILRGEGRAELEGAGEDLSARLAEEAHQAGLASDLARFTELSERGAVAQEGPATRALRGRPVQKATEAIERRRGLPESATTPEERAGVELRRRVDRGEVPRDPDRLADEYVAILKAEGGELPEGMSKSDMAGFIERRTMAALGRGGVGAAVGGTIGETPEERIMNAIGLGTLGVVGPRAARRVGIWPSAKDKLSGLPEHSRRIQERIHWSSEGPPTSHAELGSEIWGGLWEGTAPLKRFDKPSPKKLTDMEQAYMWGRALQTSRRRGLGFMQAGPGRYNAEGVIEPTGTPGLSDIAKRINNDFDALDRYRVAQRVITDLKGKATGFDDFASRLEVAGAPANIKQAARDIVRFEEDIIQYMTDAGLVGEAERLAMKAANPNHATFLRLIDKMRLPAGEKAKLLKEYVGGEQPILSPWLSTIAQTSRMVRAADLNRVRLNILRAVEASPEAMADIARLAPTKETAIRVSNIAREYQTLAAERGVQMTPEAAQFILDKSGESYFKSSLGDGVLTVYRDGKPIRLLVDEQTVKSLGSLEPFELPVYLRWAGDLKGLLTAGVTSVPEFFTRNLFRDASQAAVQTQYGGASKWVPFLRASGGLKESVKANWGKTPSEVYKTVVRGGLGFNIARGGGIKNIHAMNREIARPLNAMESVVRTVKHPWEALQMVGRPFEEASRIPEYMASRKAGQSDVRAVMASQDVSVNFQETGYWPTMRALQMMVPFLGPTLQGGRTVTQLMRTAPKRTTQAALITSVIPATMLWFANRKDTEIQELRRRSGGHNWFYIRQPATTPEAAGEIIRVPKDFTYQRVVSTFTEALLDMTYLKDPDAIEDWAVTGMREFGTNTLPVPLNVGLGVVSGKDPYFQTPLEDPATQGLPPHMRGTDYTGPIAKYTAEKVSQALDVLPRGTPFVEGAREALTPGNIEYMARGFGGTMGASVLKMADDIVNLVQSGDSTKVSPPARELADSPLTLGFVARRATTAVRSVQDFYDLYNRIRETQAGIDADEDSEAPSRVARARETRAKNVGDLSLLRMLENYHKMMKLERDAIEDVLDTPDNILSRERKAEERMIHIQEIQMLAREVMSEVRTIQKANK